MQATDDILGFGPAGSVRRDGFVFHFGRPYTHEDLRHIVEELQLDARALPDRARGTIIQDLPSVGTVAIKEYLRRGLVRRAILRTHLRRGPTRPRREFAILRLARAAGIRAPEPVAYIERGRLFYRGWIVTRWIKGGRTLAELRRADALTLARIMNEVGRQIVLLIKNRIHHVDLHPGNVLVNADDTPYLVDFDKAALHTGSLERLRACYIARWRRAVLKHGLPHVMAERLSHVLAESFS
jgi:3-deoxy-D-manno-octulosonic acid kinase